MQNNITNKSTCSYFIIGWRPGQGGSRCGALAAECGAMVSRRQRGGWLAGRVGAVVVVSRWRRGRRTCSRVRVVVATSSGSGCGGCGLGELAASGGRCGELRWRGL